MRLMHNAVFGPGWLRVTSQQEDSAFDLQVGWFGFIFLSLCLQVLQEFIEDRELPGARDKVCVGLAGDPIQAVSVCLAPIKKLK